MVFAERTLIVAGLNAELPATKRSTTTEESTATIADQVAKVEVKLRKRF